MSELLVQINFTAAREARPVFVIVRHDSVVRPPGRIQRQAIAA